MKISDRKSNRRPEINITPLVDVMLVLLVIFMVVAPSMHSDIEVRVPNIQHAKSGVENSDKKDLVKIIIAQNKLFINEKEITVEQLCNELAQYSAEMIILIKADKELAYEKVYHILDVIKGAGFHNIALVGLAQ